MNTYTNYKKYSLLLTSVFALFLFQACKKNKNQPTIIPPAAGMLSDYGYKPGTYWIFQDSLSGTTDSAYVAYYNTYLIYESCVLTGNTPEHQQYVITIKVNDGNANDTETWTLTLLDSNANISFANNKNNAINDLGYRLFTYPIATGIVQQPFSCVISPDSAYVTNIFSTYTVSDVAYTNTASILQTNIKAISASYNDWFYISPQAGFVKVNFNHPNATTAYSRVLNLMRYHIVN